MSVSSSAFSATKTWISSGRACSKGLQFAQPFLGEQHGDDAEAALQQAAHDLLAFGDEDALLPVLGLPPHGAVGLQLGQIEGLDLLGAIHRDQAGLTGSRSGRDAAWEVSSRRTWCAPIFCEAVVDDAVGEFGAIALAAQVAEVEMAQVGGHDLLGGISGGLVREMAVPAQDALLEAPGAAGAILQHFDVVVGLQHQRMGGADPFEHQARGVAEVGQEADVAGAGAEQEADRVLGVVRNAERLDQ